jgi:Sulfotransferase domain
MKDKSGKDNCLRLSMWSGPRNVSTALMYSFRQRSDTVVFDEPLYGHYLHVSGADHPGKDEVLATMNTKGQQVVEDVLLAPCTKPIRFYKNMAHHLLGLNQEVLAQMKNMLLVRDPREMLPSLAKQIPNPILRDTGLKEQVEILEVMLQRGQNPVVIDAKELLLNPKIVLQDVCQGLEIPFEDGMLSWPSGTKPEDGIWAKYWYDNVHASTGFGKYEQKQEAFPERLKPLLEECLPLYRRLNQYAIKSA